MTNSSSRTATMGDPGDASPRARARLRHVDLGVHRLVPRGSGVLVLLVLLTLALGLVMSLWMDATPVTTLMFPLVLANLVLGPRQLPWFVVFVLLVLAVVVPLMDRIETRVAVEVGVMFSVGFLVLVSSFRRSQLGVGGLQGEQMFVDLRDRILSQGGIPALPPGWHAESELRSAGGTLFAGDFVVASRRDDVLDVVVVDVSGKGEGASTRALLLSGAFGGLLGALRPAEFLDAANTFLLRQDWDEGFATAIHLSLDVRTGAYEVRSAGHPPAAVREAGSGRWRVVETEGPVLGLIDGATYEPVAGVMRHGDTMLLYTDGMVETPTRDIGLGIDRMLGQAERLLHGESEGGAARLIEALGSRHDDRALLLLHRR